MYNTISNGIILNLVRSLHDQVASVNNYSKPATWAIYQNPIPCQINHLSTRGGWGGGGAASWKPGKRMKWSSPRAAFRCEVLPDPDFFVREWGLLSLSFSFSRKEAINAQFWKVRSLNTTMCYFLQIPKRVKFYLIPHMMTFVAWKQCCSRFSEQHDFSASEIICIFRLLKFVCTMKVNFWHKFIEWQSASI